MSKRFRKLSSIVRVGSGPSILSRAAPIASTGKRGPPAISRAPISIRTQVDRRLFGVNRAITTFAPLSKPEVKELEEKLGPEDSFHHDTQQNFEQQADAQDELPIECIDILKYLGSRDKRPSQQIASNFNMPEQRIQYFLDLLYERRLVQKALRIGGGSLYSLSKSGRKLLYERGLL